MNKRIVSFFFLLLFAGSLYAAIGITDLRTEQLKNPAGIDDALKKAVETVEEQTK